jgi:hypothetical protein
MPVTIDDLTPLLRSKIHDLSRRVTQEPIGTGDGTQTIFNIDYPPIVADSERIYVDSILQTDPTNYSFDDEFGEVTFVTPPTRGSKITARYKGVAFDTTDIGNFLRNAAEELALCYSTTTFTINTAEEVDPTPTQSEKWLIVYQARLSVLQAQAQRWAAEGIRMARTGMSVDTSRRAEWLIGLCDKLAEDLKRLCDKEALRKVRLSIDERLKW